MWLRFLVNQWLQGEGKQRIYEVVADAVRSQRGERPNGVDSSNAEPNEEVVPPPPCDVAVLFALNIEAGGFVDLLQVPLTSRYDNCVEHAGKLGSKQLIVAETGVGRIPAGQVAEEVIRCHKPTWLISAGFAGALQDGPRRGHIVMAETIVDTAGNELETGLKLDARTLAGQPSLHNGRLLTVDNLVRTEEEKRKLGEQFSAVVCDMETAAVAEVCRRNKTRFLSVRVVTDRVDDQLPPEIESLLGQKTFAGKLGAAAGAIFNRPSSVKDMWNLREEAIKASDRLAKFLRGTIEQLV